MDQILVSVVIPVYNVENYLNRCVQSVMNQTLKNIEIILVDDGSPDNCPTLCDEFALIDNRIKVIHKKNGGLASARNAGMKIAKGEYLFFVDSDDWLELDGLEILYNDAKKYNVDFVRYRAIRTGWPNLEENAPCMVEDVREMNGGFYNKDKIIKEIYPRLITTSQLTMGPIVGAWGSLYRLDFLKENNLYFDEEIKFSEDMIFSAKVVLNCKNFYYREQAGIYHYFYNDKSISKSFRADRWLSCKQIIYQFEKTFSEYKEYDFKNQLILLRWFCISLGLNERKYINDKKQRKEYCQKILNDKLVKETKLKFSILNVSIKQKILMVLIKMKFTYFICEV